MNIFSKIAAALAAIIVLCACTATEPPPPITGTWEFVSHAVVISAKDPEIAARIEEKYNALLQDSGRDWAFTFYDNGKCSRTEGQVSGLYMTYSATEDAVTLSFPTDYGKNEVYAYAMTRDADQMYWSYDFIGNLEEGEIYSDNEKPVRLIDAARATITLKRK